MNARGWLVAGLLVAGTVFIDASESDFTSAVRPEEPQERHLRNLRQLTDGGDNAEAYFSGDGKRLIFQTTHGMLRCDQIFTMRDDGTEKKMVSTGKGRTTCSYFLPDGSRIIYASTHEASADCPPPPPRTGGYFWAVHSSFEIYSAKPDGSELKRLTESPGYDAEATVSADGKKILFTSVRDGDLDLYVMSSDGSEPTRLTRTLGYDGGGFFSADGKMICFRASRPRGEKEENSYRELLARDLVKPSALEIFVMNADGTNMRQVTRNGAANFCPFFHPSGKRLIFASNQSDPRAQDAFDLYMINIDGTGEERVTFHRSFDAFPMFSPDGKRLVWASNRFQSKPRETNIFIADWVE
jgi:Tol biopolymer transport system component